MAKVIEGTCNCAECKREIPVKSTDGGGVSVCCPWCDNSQYAKAGTEAHGLIMARTKKNTTTAMAVDEGQEKRNPAPSKKSLFA